MGMVVQHNMNAINAYNKLNANVAGLKKASEKLSSGYRINRAGDDAAGLAISEKMRSQIRGLNQAVRNSQDGINMIQTFEGAAQETHSILQRMKELAMESANGTYDNATDRAAIQLEFDQLNDELNQIADTDFNGTIVLNGGEMSDGLKAVDGEFDYANKKADVIQQAKDMLRAETAAANKALGDAQKAIKNNPNDLSALGDAPEWNTVDENAYNKAGADQLWIDLGITKKAADGTTDVADTSAVTEVEITYEWDGSAWNIKTATGNNGLDYTTEAKANLTVTTSDNNNIATGEATPGALASTNTGLGGFNTQVSTGFADGYGNAAGQVISDAVFDMTTLAKGDTVTLVYTNGENTKYAPVNAGWADDTYVDDRTDTQATPTKAQMTITLPESDTSLTGPSATKISDNTMTADIAKAYETLNGQTVSLEYASGTTKGIDIKIGDATVDGTKTAKQGLTVGDYTFQVQLDAKTNGAATKLDIYDKDGTQLLATIKFDSDVADADEEIAGKLSGVIAIDKFQYVDNSAAIDVRPGENKALSTTKEYQNIIKNAQDKLASLADVKVTDFETAKAYLTSRNVSISDSYDNSTARMTYTDNLTLQTGARTKDSVNFSFKYNTDGSADMGALKANLNLSSRADGLNTANLSLANQKDANYAIDQIDKAINKTSMVRATFGSIQNRLEHKITNLTTTSENLTEAESSIRDTDMASEMMNYTKFNILQQAAQSMLAQANQQPQSILQLLG